MSSRTISFVPYQLDWPDKFSHEAALLKVIFAPILLEIEHIGSTSVVDLAAKPIIDILVVVNDLSQVNNLNSALSALGYCPRGENGITGRRYFQKGGDQRSHHLHVFEADHIDISKHKAFRDYLRAFPLVASQYAEIKRLAAIQADNNSARYQSLKDDFVTMYVEKALAWKNKA
jgi:GrpB-like predicted nucleotidyltransferase (UPF0157 family)